MKWSSIQSDGSLISGKLLDNFQMAGGVPELYPFLTEKYFRVGENYQIINN